jgi:predicted nucleic acid-binding Zn ribbon protein
MEALNVTTILCPNCGAALEPTAATCRQCGGIMAKQQSDESLARSKQLLDRPWVIVVLLLHVGLLGIPLYWKTNYSLGVRLFLVVASIIYTVGAVTFIVVMVQWLFHQVTGG